MPRRKRIDSALLTALTCVFSLFMGCGEDSSAPGQPGSSCPKNAADKCELVDGLMRPMSCRMEVWAAHPACDANSTCAIVSNLGAVCVDADDGVPIVCENAPIDCDDANHCTVDTCTTKGCVHAVSPSPIACQNGNVCATTGTCKPDTGVCQASDQVGCDDLNPCTTDTCDPKTGCGHTPISGCTLCEQPGPSPHTATRRTWEWTSMAWAPEGCDLDLDGKPDNGLFKIGATGVIGPSTTQLQDGGGLLVAAMGNVWRAETDKGTTTVSILDRSGPACPVDTAQPCSVTVDPGSYTKTKGTGACPAKRAFSATTQLKNGVVTLENATQVLPNLRWPIGFACPGDKFNPVPFFVQAQQLQLRVTMSTEQPQPDDSTLKVCGTITPEALIQGFGEAHSTCESQLGTDVARQLVTGLFKPDIDSDGDGKPDVLSFAFVIKGRRADFGGVKEAAP